MLARSASALRAASRSFSSAARLEVQQAPRLDALGTRRIFDEEHDMLREAARNWWNSAVVPHHAAWEDAGEVPRELWREAGAQVDTFRRRLRQGHKLLFFPEGTSTDGRRVLPFKTTLFAAFFEPSLRESMSIQPVSMIYHAPPGEDPRFFGWWGDMDLGPSLVKVLAQAPQGRVELVYHPAVRVADYADRKALGEAMWSVALADGHRHEQEEIQLAAIETALGLTDLDIQAARSAALRSI